LPRANAQITVATVRLITESGEMLGIVSLKDALRKAEAAELDLVEISPNADPPVCKIMDFSKYKYELKKKAHDAKKKQKIVELKEIILRPNISPHDLEIKIRSITKFINHGDKVKISVKFRGREITHDELGLRLLNKIKEGTSDIAKCDLEPKIDEKQMLMMLSPKTLQA